jgi:hypothetical protein
MSCQTGKSRTIRDYDSVPEGSFPTEAFVKFSFNLLPRYSIVRIGFEVSETAIKLCRLLWC